MYIVCMYFTSLQCFRAAVPAAVHVLQIMPRPISVSVSSTVTEPAAADWRQPADESMKPRASVAVDAVSDGYEQPQPESNRESWATEFNDDCFYDG